MTEHSQPATSGPKRGPWPGLVTQPTIISMLLGFVQRRGREDQPCGFWKGWRVLLLLGGKHEV